MQKNQFKVGVTGGIGSGKSGVCKEFKIMGVPIYDSDARAKEIMVKNPTVIYSIKKKFGRNAYLESGMLNRSFLASEVFEDEEKLHDINNIVHPVVAQDFEEWITQHKRSPYVIKEAALLIESGSYMTLDYIVTVTSPKELRINRVLARDRYRTLEEVNSIISRQLSDIIKLEKSQFEIVNDDKSLVIPQILKIHNQMISSIEAG